MNAHDPVDRAFELLRDAQGSELPDPALEARLRARAAEPRRRSPRIAAVAIALLALSGVAFTAGGGLRALGRWWYEIVLDGASSSETVEGNGERTTLFQDQYGYGGSVRIRRDHDETGRLRTRIDVHRESAGRVEHDRAENVFGARSSESLPESMLQGATAIHSGSEVEVYAIPGEPDGTRILVRGSRIEEIARLPFSLWQNGAGATIVETEGGGLELAFESGDGSAIELAWRPPGARGDPASRPATLETPDGRVKVRVENEPHER